MYCLVNVVLQHFNRGNASVASVSCSIQCKYAARVREKVATRSPRAKWALWTVLYQVRFDGRARLDLHMLCLCSSVAGANPSQILCLDRSLDVWTLQSLRSHTASVPGFVTAVFDPVQIRPSLFPAATEDWPCISSLMRDQPSHFLFRLEKSPINNSNRNLKM